MVHRVFVSSTTDDLGKLRELVSKQVQGFSHRPVSMASMGQEGRPTVAACLNAVDSCDLYIGLIAGTYGTIPADGNPGQHSFTELEYRRAYQSGKEIYWFVQRLPDAAIDGRVKMFRKLLEESHNPGHFTTEDDLAPMVDKVLFDWTRRRNLELELATRYNVESRAHRFKIVQSTDKNRDAAVASAAAREFVSYIINRIQEKIANNSAEDLVVGVTGGNAQKQLVEFIDRNSSTLIGDSHRFGDGRLIFLALNSASLPDRYTHTANFLTARLSQLFPGSRHYARLRVTGAKEQSTYEGYCRTVRLILGGAAERDGFLSEWLKSLTPSKKLPQEFFGDFCYVPVDRDGRAIPPETLRELGGVSELDINSGLSFEHLKGVQVPVILPLSKSRWLDPLGNEGFTKKGRIGDLVLQHVSNCICVLDEYTAGRLLSRRLCGHRVRDDIEASFDQRGHLYQAIAGSNGAGSTDDLRIVHQDAHGPRTGGHSDRHVAEILISDPPGPRDRSQRNLLVEGKAFSIDGTEGVRRPGLWSTTLVRSGLRMLREGQTAAAPSILDMGCGCGVVGCLMASLWTCDQVVFADIQPAALQNARGNVDRMRADPLSSIARATKFEYVCGNLFEKLPPSGQFDLILFCPPFFPEWILEAGALPKTDANDPVGIRTALLFADAAAQYLRPGGAAIIAIAGYVDYPLIDRALSGAGLVLDKRERSRRILYPYFPDQGWPVASEIRYRAKLEQWRQRKLFRDEYWKAPDSAEPAHYLAFDMVHIIASKPVAKGHKLRPTAPAQG